MAFRALSKYDFCFVGMGFPEVGSLGMEANGVGSKWILESADQAKSPRRILVRSLLKSRNKLREKYRELRAECKRWRNQAAAVERSRSTWRERTLAHEASAQEDRAARAKLESQLQHLRCYRNPFMSSAASTVVLEQQRRLGPLWSRFDPEFETPVRPPEAGFSFSPASSFPARK